MISWWLGFVSWKSGLVLDSGVIPSGNLTVCYWKWQFIVHLFIKNVIFHSYGTVYQRVTHSWIPRFQITEAAHVLWMGNFSAFFVVFLNPRFLDKSSYGNIHQEFELLMVLTCFEILIIKSIWLIQCHTHIYCIYIYIYIFLCIL